MTAAHTERRYALGASGQGRPMAAHRTPKTGNGAAGIRMTRRPRQQLSDIGSYSLTRSTSAIERDKPRLPFTPGSITGEQKCCLCSLNAHGMRQRHGPAIARNFACADCLHANSDVLHSTAHAPATNAAGDRRVSYDIYYVSIPHIYGGQ
eukprot:1159268-Pleurochrysis_carterae.AAC.2